jgi:hypothetical protein
MGGEVKLDRDGLTNRKERTHYMKKKEQVKKINIKEFHSLGTLAEHYGETTIDGLLKAFYDETPFGVSARFINRNGKAIDTNKQTFFSVCTHCVGIEFSTIVEGSDAEFTADTIYFPITLDDIQKTYDHLEALSDEAWSEANKD